MAAATTGRNPLQRSSDDVRVPSPMRSFIVHAQGFVLESTAELLREHGAPVIEAPVPAAAAKHLADAPTAVLVCNSVPPASDWHRRRVVLLDGVDDDGIAHLMSGGAQVARPPQGKLDALIEEVLADVPTPVGAVVELPPPPPRALLTGRQVEVVELISRGLTSQEIGKELGLRPKTVENYKQRLFARLGVQNQAHAVARCSHLGLIGERPLAS